MKINKNSWHYALVVGKDTESAPKTLCGYFWNLVGKLFLVAFFLCVAIVGFIIAPIGAVAYIRDGKVGDAILLLLPWIIVGSVVGIVFLVDFLKKKKNSMVFQYLAAIKGKYCPLIEYVKEDK